MPAFFYILIAMLAVSLFALDIRVGIEADGKLLQNEGGFRVRVFGLLVYKGKFHAESKDPIHNALIVEHKAKKRAEIHLNADKRDKKSVAAIISSPLFSAVRIKKISLDVVLGARHDPFFTTMAFGTVRIALYSVLSLIKSRYHPVITESLTPDYTADRLDFAVNAKVRISLGGIIYELLSKYLTRKSARRTKSRVRLEEPA